MENMITKRYDITMFFDVKDGNPNGDPDAGNLPRIDAETGMGLVTDVCLKRKVRNFVQLTQVETNEQGVTIPKKGFDIYVKEKAVLGRAHTKAFNELGITLGEESRTVIPDDISDKIMEISLPEGITVEETDDEKYILVIPSDADIKTVKDFIKESKPEKTIKDFLISALKGVKARKPKSEEVERGKVWMCQNFFDIRTFGAVMSLKSAPNCGQVRGPVQFTFARSVQPVVALEHSITRMAVATEAESEKQSGDNRTMGRKFTIPYGLYQTFGFISAHLANQTGFSTDDLAIFWKALQEMFEHDHSAARGLMSTRAIIVFEHSTALGNKPAYELFNRVTWKRVTTGPARSFNDYELMLDGKKIEKIFNIVLVGS